MYYRRIWLKFSLLPRNFDLVVLLIRMVARFVDPHEFNAKNIQNIFFYVRFIRLRFAKFPNSCLKKIVAEEKAHHKLKKIKKRTKSIEHFQI